MRKVDMQSYKSAPQRYELRSGQEVEAPACPYGNRYKWIGYDLQAKEYVRFTKSVFKLLVQQKDVNANANSNTNSNAIPN